MLYEVITRAGTLFIPDDLLHLAQPETAVLLRPVGPGPAVLIELALPLAVELCGLVAMGRPRVPGNIVPQPVLREIFS